MDEKLIKVMEAAIREVAAWPTWKKVAYRVIPDPAREEPMTLEELVAECEAAVESPHRTDVLLVVSRKSAPSGFKARLFGRHGPLGEIMQYNPETGEMVGYWPADKVLAYLQKISKEET